MPRVLNKKQAIALREQEKPYLATCKQVVSEFGDGRYWRVKNRNWKKEDWLMGNNILYNALLNMNTILGSYLHGPGRAKMLWPNLFTSDGVDLVRWDLERLHGECVTVQDALGVEAEWHVSRRKAWRLNNDCLARLLLDLQLVAGRFAASPTMMSK